MLVSCFGGLSNTPLSYNPWQAQALTRRHLQYLNQCRLYIQQFRNFIVEMDREDPESLHFIGVRKGMSYRKCKKMRHCRCRAKACLNGG